MKALVTGAAGFLGRHFTAELHRRGWSVTRCDIALGWDAHDAFRDDITYDLVVHCAAAEPHRTAIDGKPMLLAANLQLDAAMFEWAVRTGARVLYFSSSAAYPVALQSFAAGGRRLREDDIGWGQAMGRPDANYGWTKLTGELLARNAAETGLPVHVVRPFSGYGEDQSLNFPFPAILDRARRGDLTVWGPEGQTRDWIHVSDVVGGALAVVAADERRPVNLCTGRGVEMGQLAREVARQAGAPIGDVVYLADKPTGVHHRVGDPNRMLQHYQPKVSLEEGIARALRARAA